MRHLIRSLPSLRPATVLALVAVFAVTGVALAVGQAIPRQVVTGGGGQIAGGDLTLRSVIGQPAVGAVSNGTTLCSGFNCGAGAAAQAPISTATPVGSPTPGSSGREVYLPIGTQRVNRGW